jgi:hypothetical protein
MILHRERVRFGDWGTLDRRFVCLGVLERVVDEDAIEEGSATLRC